MDEHMATIDHEVRAAVGAAEPYRDPDAPLDPGSITGYVVELAEKSLWHLAEEMRRIKSA